MTKPFSQACENNKKPILAVLKRWLYRPAKLVEIGSGTGQHAVYFAQHLPHVIWQATDRKQNLGGIKQWLDDARLVNLQPVRELDVTTRDWKLDPVDAIFSANTVHIMGWPVVEQLLQKIPDYLNSGGLFFLYGPFNYNRQYTSESNARFDHWLKIQDPSSGIRDFESVNSLLKSVGMHLEEDNAMPSNNRLLVWCKKERSIPF